MKEEDMKVTPLNPQFRRGMKALEQYIKAYESGELPEEITSAEYIDQLPESEYLDLALDALSEVSGQHNTLFAIDAVAFAYKAGFFAAEA